MVTLAFDTSSDRGSVAVARSGVVLSEKSWSREGSHGELLLPAIEFCLQEAGVVVKDLDSIAIGHGPGSFTGVRVAVNAARTIAYAARLPVHAFDTSEILAAQSTRTDLPIAVLINAHKNLIFASTFVTNQNEAKRLIPLAAYSSEELGKMISAPHLAIGDGYEVYEQVFPQNVRPWLIRDPSCDDFPRATTLVRLASDPRMSRPLVWKDVQALYIRPSGAEENLRIK